MQDDDKVQDLRLNIISMHGQIPAFYLISFSWTASHSGDRPTIIPTPIRPVHPERLRQPLAQPPELSIEDLNILVAATPVQPLEMMRHIRNDLAQLPAKDEVGSERRLRERSWDRLGSGGLIVAHVEVAWWSDR